MRKVADSGLVLEARQHLCAIVDVNRLGQSGPHPPAVGPWRKRFEAFGWHVIERPQRHDAAAVHAAYQAESGPASGRWSWPAPRRCRDPGWRTSPNAQRQGGSSWRRPSSTSAATAASPSPGAKPEGAPAKPLATKASGEVQPPTYELGEKETTRKAYGDAVAAIGAARADVVAIDGEVSNSTFSEIFRFAHPQRYIERAIAECQLIATAGMQVPVRCSPRTSLCSCPGPTTSCAWPPCPGPHLHRRVPRRMLDRRGRAVDMALEDLAAFRALHSSVVLTRPMRCRRPPWWR